MGQQFGLGSLKFLKPPYFRLFKDKAGEYRWTLHGGNGEAVATSEGYTQKSSCKRSAERVKELAPKAEIRDEMDKQ
jgi:uncharacterized protein YegP (UPF0339 family)